MPTPNDFTNFQFGRDKSAERDEGKLGTAGDFGPVAFAPLNGDVPADVYPNIVGGGESLGGDKESDPFKLQEEADRGARVAAELQGWLNDSLYVAGSRVCNDTREAWKPAHPGAPGAGDGKTGPA